MFLFSWIQTIVGGIIPKRISQSPVTSVTNTQIEPDSELAKLPGDARNEIYQYLPPISHLSLSLASRFFQKDPYLQKAFLNSTKSKSILHADWDNQSNGILVINWHEDGQVTIKDSPQSNTFEAPAILRGKVIRKIFFDNQFECNNIYFIAELEVYRMFSTRSGLEVEEVLGLRGKNINWAIQNFNPKIGRNISLYSDNDFYKLYVIDDKHFEPRITLLKKIELNCEFNRLFKLYSHYKLLLLDDKKRMMRLPDAKFTESTQLINHNNVHRADILEELKSLEEKVAAENNFSTR